MIDGGELSLVHVTVRDAVVLLPQASTAVNVLVCVRSQPLLPILPSLCVTVGLLHPSVADADPSAILMAVDVGLQPNGTLANEPENTGAVKSEVQLAVRATVDVLPQPSVAKNVLVCEKLHPLVVMLPSLWVTVGTPHPSVADAEPRAAFIAVGVGLQPNGVLLNVPLNTGGVRSDIHVAVLEAVAVLPQASVAVKVRV